MIKVIVAMVHRPTQESTEVIFHSAAVLLHCERSQRETTIPWVTEICLCLHSSELCKLIIHHCALTLEHKQCRWCVTEWVMVPSSGWPLTPKPDQLTLPVSVDEQKYGSQSGVNMDVIAALITQKTLRDGAESADSMRLDTQGGGLIRGIMLHVVRIIKTINLIKCKNNVGGWCFSSLVHRCDWSDWCEGFWSCSDAAKSSSAET